MKRTIIIAMLVVFALFATPLWTTNANAETIDDPAVITYANWDYCIYADESGIVILASPQNEEIHGADGDVCIMMQKARHDAMMATIQNIRSISPDDPEMMNGKIALYFFGSDYAIYGTPGGDFGEFMNSLPFYTVIAE